MFVFLEIFSINYFTSSFMSKDTSEDGQWKENFEHKFSIEKNNIFSIGKRTSTDTRNKHMSISKIIYCRNGEIGKMKNEGKFLCQCVEPDASCKLLFLLRKNGKFLIFILYEKSEKSSAIEMFWIIAVNNEILFIYWS